jgi:16S rRNA (guanine966-N2)-methyltransferase
MRIIAGSLGGRLFDSPGTHKTHPMSDRVRGALFNVLGDISDLTVLDAFAGSGALSFEAASRGAGKVIAIDSDHAAQKVIGQNIARLKLQGKVKLIKASAGTWASTNLEAMFDLVLCDPPYDASQPELLQCLAERVKSGGIIVFSLPPNHQIKLSTASYRQRVTKSYGDAQLLFFVRV